MRVGTGQKMMPGALILPLTMLPHFPRKKVPLLYIPQSFLQQAPGA